MRSSAKEWRVEPQRRALRREPKRSRSLSNGLLARHRLSPSHLLRALRLGGANQTALPTTLRRYGLVDDHSLASELSSATGAEWLSPDLGLPDPRLITKIGAGVAMELGCLPWARLGSTTLIACPDPNQFRRHKARLESLFGPVTLALITEADLDRALALACGESLRDAALRSVPPDQSCREMDADRITRFTRWSALVLFPVVALWPLQLLLAITCIVITILFISSGLRLACATAALATPPQSREAADPEVPPDELPVISVLVPLYREADIAPRLIARLGALAYPREKVDVLVLVEEDDEVTRNALAGSDLPAWMREVPVPAAALRTKPRALNYGLNFARGSIIGIYDAEDAPEANQLMLVARGFAGSGPNVACLQGVLDYYNPATNWLSRCFTIEYAAWFRLVLPGLERLGLVVPLGGTTLFFRRNILESLGGWDAWNVTEDADLGLRLARKGYKTRLLSSVTFEEANCEVRPWIKQRSRWLKGYAMTWLSHMRRPRALWRDLGPWRFFGIQMLLFGTLVHFLLAPILWTFWLILAGIDLPWMQLLPEGTMSNILMSLVFLEIVSLGITFLALRAKHHRWLRPWALSLPLYFPFATIAAWKAAIEMLRAPFYWDKTSHGRYDQPQALNR